MSTHKVRVFRLPFTRAAQPAQHNVRPVEEGGFVVEALDHDAAKAEVRKRLAAFKEDVRSASHGVDGAVVAVVYAKK